MINGEPRQSKAVKKLTDIFPHRRWQKPRSRLHSGFLVVSFMGFCNGLIDVLNKRFQNTLNM